jgi:hypothetical protein
MVKGATFTRFPENAIPGITDALLRTFLVMLLDFVFVPRALKDLVFNVALRLSRASSFAVFGAETGTCEKLGLKFAFLPKRFFELLFSLINCW